MAILHVAEFSHIGTDYYSSSVLAPLLNPSVQHNLAIGAVAVQSAPFRSSTRFIRVYSDALCRIIAGADPQATASDVPIPANSVEFFTVRPGDKISVIAA